MVKEKYVSGWDDPRMPTICGLRRRGYTPESLRNFAEKVGIAKRDNVIDVSLLEFCLREDLNKRATRVMCVMNPLKITLENYPEGQVEWMDAINNPEDESMGTRKVPFSKELYIEREDFLEDAPKKFYRLSPGVEVRLRYAYFITCKKVIKDPATGEILELICTYDPASQGGNSPDGRKVKGTLHWVSVPHALSVESRLYDRLFNAEDPEKFPEGEDYKYNLNKESLKVQECFIEPSVENAKALDKFQFERIGYFCLDTDSLPGKLVFNRTVTLKDSWSKIAQRITNWGKKFRTIPILTSLLYICSFIA